MNAKGLLPDLITRQLLSVFIVFHIASLVSYAINPSWTLKKNFISAPYIHAFGLYQNWLMFEKAPTGNYYLVFFVNFKNGSREYIEFAHMDELDFLKKLQMHRFRKFQQSSVFNPSNSFLWKDLCIWIMHNYPEQRQSQVESITLARKYFPLLASSSPPGQGKGLTTMVYTYYPSRENLNQ